MLGLDILLRRVDELAGLPDLVAVTADQMRTGVAIGLRVNDHDSLADLRRHRILAGQGADLADEHDVGRDHLAHHLGGVGERFAHRFVSLVFAFLVLGSVEVVLAGVLEAIVAQRLALAVFQTVTWQHHHGAVHA